jgi:hypothetical protein
VLVGRGSVVPRGMMGRGWGEMDVWCGMAGRGFLGLGREMDGIQGRRSDSEMDLNDVI